MSAVVSSLPILIVEDDPPARELYRSILRQAGYRALTAEDGLTALRCVEDRPVAAVVLDLVLPRFSGRELYQEMKARPDMRHIPIIIVSGHDVSDLDQSAFACVLRKPLDPDALLAAVNQCIMGSSGLNQPQGA